MLYIQLTSLEETISWYNRDVTLYLLKLDVPIFLTILTMNSTKLKEKNIMSSNEQMDY